MPEISRKQLDKFMKEHPDSDATVAMKEQLKEAGDSIPTAKAEPKRADGGAVDLNKSMSIIERNRGKFDFVLMEHDVVNANIKLIGELHCEIQRHEKIGLEKAIQIGELLYEIKKRIQYKKFGRWGAEHLPFTVRTGQNYMKLYYHKDELASKNITALSEAYAALRGEATPDEVIDADDSVDTEPKWKVVDTHVSLDTAKPLPKKKAKGGIKNLTINQETITRMKNQEFPFEDSRGKYIKIVVNVPAPGMSKVLVGEFIIEASQLLMAGGKLIIHKK